MSPTQVSIRRSDEHDVTRLTGRPRSRLGATRPSPTGQQVVGARGGRLRRGGMGRGGGNGGGGGGGGGAPGGPRAGGGRAAAPRFQRGAGPPPPYRSAA